MLVLEVTHGCQSGCVTCDFRGPAGHEDLTPEVAAMLCREASQRGCDQVAITGGEPLLRSDIFALLAGIDLPVTLLTNGLLVARHADDIASHCQEVIVSLDGWDEASYRAIRGVPGFGEVAAGVRALNQRRVPVSARVTVSAHNAGQLDAIVAAAHRMGLHGVSLLAADNDSTETFGREGSSPSTPLDADALRRELQALSQTWEDFVTDSDAALQRVWQKHAADAGHRPHIPPRCDAPWTSAVVGPDLSVKPCFFLPAYGRADAGLGPALAAGRSALQGIDVASNPVCARCVCWARWT